MVSWIFNIPTGWAFVLFTAGIVFLSLLGLFLYGLIGISSATCPNDNNNLIGIFIAIISIFMGVILAFIIVEVSNNFDLARSNAIKEANTLFLLYQTVSILPNTEETQGLIIDYLEYIINEEYPALNELFIPDEGGILTEELEVAIYSYMPGTGTNESTLYGQSINLLNTAVNLRIDRLEAALIGINPLIWWVTIVDSVLLIIMSWLLNCGGPGHYVMVAIVAIYVATAIFLALILAYPFTGDSRLLPTPFEIALEDIMKFNEEQGANI